MYHPAVVPGLRDLHPEPAIPLGARRAVPERHDRARLRRPPEVRHVHALDVARRGGEAEPPRQLPAHLERLLRAFEAGGERGGCVLLRHVDECPLPAAARDGDPDAPAAGGGKLRGKSGRAGGRRGGEDLRGHEGAPEVVPPERLRDHGRVVAPPVDGEQAPAEQAPGAHEEQSRLGAVPLPGHTHRIAVGAVEGDAVLPFDRRADRRERIADPARLLETERRGLAAHLPLEFAEEAPAAAGEEQGHAADERGVAAPRDAAAARGRAAPDLMLDAGAGAALKGCGAALPERERALEEPGGVSRGPHRRVRPEPARPVAAEAAYDLEARVLLVG